ncbi:MAG: OmpW family outer membrane protein [Hyphomicrobiaceae bacterium]
MINMRNVLASVAIAGVAMVGAVLPAAAGSETGNFMVRLQGTVVAPDSSADVTVNGAPLAGADAEVSSEFVPTATLTYFLNQNLAVELLCCFAKHSIDGKGTIAGLNEIADTWIFPPAVTVQYHFNDMGGFKPYVGAGVQYIAFFDEGVGDNALGASHVTIDDAFGFTLQAGVDVSLGGGWYLNADVKKTFLDTTVTWHDTALGTVRGDAQIDPLIVSAGIGYRFNLEDIFGHRGSDIPLK